MSSMDEHRSCEFGQVANAFLRDTILMMGADATECYFLMSVANGVQETCFGKAAIVGVVLAYGDTEFTCFAFECMFGFERVIARRGLL